DHLVGPADQADADAAEDDREQDALGLGVATAHVHDQQGEPGDGRGDEDAGGDLVGGGRGQQRADGGRAGPLVADPVDLVDLRSGCTGGGAVATRLGFARVVPYSRVPITLAATSSRKLGRAHV